MKLRLAVFTTLSAGAVFATERPNVIFILYDDLGYGDVGYTFQNAVRFAARRFFFYGFNRILT